MKIGGYTLAIEGSTYEGSVALLLGSRILVERVLKHEDGAAARAGRGELLMPAVAECLQEARVRRDQIARVVCGAGPGSFTSLRVAASLSKGLANGYGVDLYAVSSLLLTVTAAQPPLPSGEYLSVLNAMRGEFYAAHITKPPWLATDAPRSADPGDNGSVEAESPPIPISPPRIISRAELDEMLLRERTVSLVGPGQQINSGPHARGVGPIIDWIVDSGPVDLASWEPDYGRLAEAQVRWEAAQGRKLAT